MLAGGFGTRLRRVVADVPKPMAPINGRPFLEILLTTLDRKGFSRVVLSLGYMGERIHGYFGERFANLELDYVTESQPLGTGGGVRLALTRSVSDHVFVFNGDTYLDLEVGKVEQQWKSNGRPIIVGREVPDASRYGRLLIADGVVTGFAEKGMSGPGLINAGCYVLNRHQLDGFLPGSAFSLEGDFLTGEVLSGTFDIYVTSGKFIDIGVPDDFQRAQSELAAS